MIAGSPRGGRGADRGGLQWVEMEWELRSAGGPPAAASEVWRVRRGFATMPDPLRASRPRPGRAPAGPWPFDPHPRILLPAQTSAKQTQATASRPTPGPGKLDA